MKLSFGQFMVYYFSLCTDFLDLGPSQMKRSLKECKSILLGKVKLRKSLILIFTFMMITVDNI